jgi:GT2 family glycosyltransferase
MSAVSRSPKISLYIPCYNVERFIVRCLEGVMTQTRPPDEILIIDDGSRDGTLELVRRFPVRIVKHETNGGLAKARNTGLREATNELVASLDADCIPDPHWLETLVAEMSSPDIASVGGRLVESVLDSVADRWRKAHMSQEWGDERIENPPFMFGNNTLVLKSVVIQAGWYDESMRTNGEDADLSRRLTALGYRLVYQPKAMVRHLRQDTVRSILDTYWRYWKFGSGSHRAGITWKRFLANSAISHLLGTVRQVLWPDLRRRNFEYIGIDIVLPVYLVCRYTALFLSQRNRKN